MLASLTAGGRVKGESRARRCGSIGVKGAGSRGGVVTSTEDGIGERGVGDPEAGVQVQPLRVPVYDPNRSEHPTIVSARRSVVTKASATERKRAGGRDRETERDRERQGERERERENAHARRARATERETGTARPKAHERASFNASGVAVYSPTIRFK